MPVDNYGVLKGIIVEGKEERDPYTPHYQIHVVDDNGINYRAAVSVMSNSDKSEILYLADDNFDASDITMLQSLKKGFHSIGKEDKKIGLDYIRGNLIQDPSRMVPLPYNMYGPNNDLNDFIDKYVKKAVNENPKPIIYVFGSRFGPEDKKDLIFDFPSLGVHNIHMNQGNKRNSKHGKDNGTWHDGGILIQFEDRWVALFLAFVSQSWITDENGYPTK